MERATHNNSFIHICDRSSKTLHSISFADLDATRALLGGEVITALHLKSCLYTKLQDTKLMDKHEICIIFNYKYLNNDDPLNKLPWKFGMGYLYWEPKIFK